MIGFIGLGIMGTPMARNLVRAGEKVMVYDIAEKAVKALEEEGAVGGTIGEIARNCELILLMLPNGQVVEAVIFGDDGMYGELKKGTIICDMSSVAPAQSRHCKEMLKEIGVGFLDAPVSGGEPKAIEGTLAFMAGGDKSDYERAERYFKIMGSSAILVGGSGSGSAAKLANQIIVNLNIAAVSEAFVLIEKLGVDPQKVYKAIRGGLAGSTVLDAKIPKILSRDFGPGGTLEINRKDINNVLQTAHAEDIPVPFTSQLFEMMQSLKVRGFMGEDHSAIVRYFEQLAEVEVGRK